MGHRTSRFLRRYASRVVAAGLVLAPSLGNGAMAQEKVGARPATLGPAQGLELCSGDYLPPISTPPKVVDQVDPNDPPPFPDVIVPYGPAEPWPTELPVPAARSAPRRPIRKAFSLEKIAPGV